jgi:hypothetical protein
METFELLENKILEIGNGKISKKEKNRINSFLLLLAGIILIIFNNNAIHLFNNEILTSFLLFMGIILLLTGIISLFFKKEKYILTENGKCLKIIKLEFDLNEFQKMHQFYEKNQFKEMAGLKKNEKSAGLILKLMGTDDGEIYYSQVLKYIPYSFVPVNAGKEHTGETATEIKNLISIYTQK